MKENDWIESGIKSQTELARILAGEPITAKARVRAHRVWNGARLHDDEIAILHKSTDGRIDANTVIGLRPKRKK